MKIAVLMGSMRKNGNTEMVLKSFVQLLKLKKAELQYIWLCDRNLDVFGANYLEKSVFCSSFHRLNY
ncbi:hypothetical protein CHISP_0792 [Chitinispirillum alkaliphilum]|nr:hypothetical protein CHISP_0792 [Chitinispirillum alkaliphilum]